MLKLEPLEQHLKTRTPEKPRLLKPKLNKFETIGTPQKFGF
jgi:hypothetical protein